MDLGLAGKVVLVTGGSKGIGLACARAFVAEGARVAIASRSADNISRARVQLGDVLGVPADLTDAAQAAALVELFPTRIRYTGMSLPYHIGNGWFGGLVPFVVFAMVAASGDFYYGLWYPIVVAAITFVVGLLFELALGRRP